MRILSVNVSTSKAVIYKGESLRTGIYKTPVSGPVMVRKRNIDGDEQADPENHGGPDMAVYAFPFEHYAFYQEHLGDDGYDYGRFGENLTTEGLLESGVHIGDRFRLGTAILEVTQPRRPCYKLAMRMGSPEVVRLMLDSARTGFYFRVVTEGELEAGAAASRLFHDDGAQSVADVHNLIFREVLNLAGLRRAVANPALGRNLHSELDGRLSKLESTGKE